MNKHPAVYILIRCLAIIFLLVASGLVMRSYAEAAWFLDADRFHAAVHGQVSCTECHEAISKAMPHPDPTAVNLASNDFFRPDQCTSCHDEVLAKLDAGSHAGKPIKDPDEYRVCISCHDPHYELSATNLPPGFDPSKPVSRQCGVCHAMRTTLPALSSHDEQCMACHRSVAVNDPDQANKIAAFCFSCHGADKSAEGVDSSAFATIDVQAYGASTHHQLSCLDCHPKAAEFGHAGQELTACLDCHHRHDEKVAHDAHPDVSCEACHLAGITPVKPPVVIQIGWRVDRKPGAASDLHNMTLNHGESSCERCHYRGNAVGASAMVLPAKSILCMPCHAATFSVGDTTTVISLLLFLVGIGWLGVVWFSGSLSTEGTATLDAGSGKAVSIRVGPLFLANVIRMLKVLALDVFLQRRLFRQSRTRWIIHGLIFFPFVFRFLWGITALLTSLWAPESSLPWVLLDRNYPLGAFLFDASGLLILLGVIFTAVRKVMGQTQAVSGLPKPDWPALCLLGSIVVIGFVLEGMRIAMTGAPVGSEYAFLGSALSRLFVNATALSDVYGTVWYLHAIVTGALVAYLPFSNLLHIIIAPVVLALNAMSETGEHQAKSSSHPQPMQPVSQ